MCEFCSEHGQDNRWYLNPENFSDKLLEDPKRAKTIEKLVGWGIDYYVDFTSRVTEMVNWPVIGKLVKKAVDRIAPKEHGGQVVSLEDSLQLLEYARDFVLLPCACRRLVSHKQEMACLNFGPVKDLMLRYVPGEPIEELTLDEARKLVRDFDRRGYFHQVLYAKIPFPICICNCEERYCTSLKQRFANGVEVALYKGHDVCKVDAERCKECESPWCASRCVFGAISYNPERGGVEVDASRCFGCGLCRGACVHDALSLVPREMVPQAAGKW